MLQISNCYRLRNWQRIFAVVFSWTFWDCGNSITLHTLC